MPIKTDIYKSNPGQVVNLFIISFPNMPTVAVKYYADAVSDGSPSIFYAGFSFTPIPIIMTDTMFTVSGALSQPKLKIAVKDPALFRDINRQQNWEGAKVTRYRTFSKYLVSGSTPSVDGKPTDVFYINRKENEVTGYDPYIEWSLSSPMDVESGTIPTTEMIKNFCPFSVRTNNGQSRSDYDDVECPYVGFHKYDINGNITTDPAEAFSKQLRTCCKPRFGNEAALPFGGFPGINKKRI